jgi:hypothetical protein
MNTLFGNLTPNFFIIGYLGPEIIMPLASILAAAIGFILLVWRSGFRFIKKSWKWLHHKITRTPLEESLVDITLEDEDSELETDQS